MLDRAKALYFAYLGSEFSMWHDGVLDEYERYRVSEEQEAEWRKELIELWVSRLSDDDALAANTLTIMHAGEALPDLLKHAERGDSFAQMMYANALWDIAALPDPANRNKVSPEIVAQAKQVAVRVWHSIVRGPVRLHKDRPDRLDPSDELEAPDRLRVWAQARLTRAGYKPDSGPE